MEVRGHTKGMLSPVPVTGAWVGWGRHAAPAVLRGAHAGESRPPLLSARCGGADQQREIDGVLSTFQASVIFVDSV